MVSPQPTITIVDFVDTFCDFVGMFAYRLLEGFVSDLFGCWIILSIYGVDAARAIVANMNPLLADTICHYVPVIAVVINYIPWEEYLLRCLRSCNRLPVLGAVMPQGDPELQPVRERSPSMYGVVVGGLFLPFFAKATCELFFGTEESPLRRFLLGGAFFLVVRGVFYMYY